MADATSSPIGVNRPLPSEKANRAWALVILTTIAAFNTIDRQLITILGAPIKAEFSLSDSQVGLIGLIYGVVFAIGAAPMAYIAARTSRRATITGCLMLFSAGTALCGVATSYIMVLVSRFAVAVGESGTAAPSQSLIADFFPRASRTLALSIFGAASKPGGFIAFLAGGWLAVWLGWRATFLIMGLPGLAVAVLAWFYVREPSIGLSDRVEPAVAKTAVPVTFRECIAYLWRTPSFWHILIGQGLWGLFTLGFVFWIPHYLSRSFGLSLGIIGTSMAFYILGVGATGLILLGWIAQKLQIRDIRWMMWILVLAALIATPCAWILLTTDSLWIAAFIAVPLMLLYGAAQGIPVSACQAIAPARMRTVTAAFLQIVIGFVSMGLGPFLPGILSDLFAARFGEMSIRYSLLCFSLIWLWAALHFFLASRTLIGDIERADIHNAA